MRWRNCPSTSAPAPPHKDDLAPAALPPIGSGKKTGVDMSRALFLAGLLAMLPLTALAQSRGEHQVVGVKGEEFLKLRAGPGTGFRVIVGLPEGTKVHVYSCERAGHTSWCKVSLKGVPALKGYVSGAYLSQE